MGTKSLDHCLRNSIAWPYLHYLIKQYDRVSLVEENADKMEEKDGSFIFFIIFGTLAFLVLQFSWLLSGSIPCLVSFLLLRFAYASAPPPKKNTGYPDLGLLWVSPGLPTASNRLLFFHWDFIFRKIAVDAPFCPLAFLNPSLLVVEWLGFFCSWPALSLRWGLRAYWSRLLSK